MGIKDLLIELKKRFPEVVLTEVYLEIFAGHRLGIDVSIYAYAYMAVARKEAIKYLQVSLEDPKPHILRSYWLEKYFQLMMAFIELDITPIPVFDGDHFRLKQDTKAKRVETYNTRENEIRYLRENLAEEPNNKKLEDKLKKEMEYHVGFNDGDWDALRQMFDTMGLPSIKAPYEAEAVCARLVRQGIATGVVSNDGDTLAHMGGIMIRDIKRSYRRGEPIHKCSCIILSEVLRVLDMSKQQFVDFCILLGTDYNDRIPGYGWVGALKMIRKHETLEGVIDELSKKLDLSKSRLIQAELRDEIRGYFHDDLNCTPKRFPVVWYENGLTECFSAIFSGYNKARMLESVQSNTKKLIEFNQKFAELQTFTLVSGKDTK